MDLNILRSDVARVSLSVWQMSARATTASIPGFRINSFSGEYSSFKVRCKISKQAVVLLLDLFPNIYTNQPEA